MNIRVLAFVISVIAVPLWMWRQRRLHTGEIQSTHVAGGLKPTKVMLPDEDSVAEERPRERPSENRELRRKVVHGPYRAIDDPGAPTEVNPERPT